MTISLSPMDYYFYRRQLYTIQFVFEYTEFNVEIFAQSLRTLEKSYPVLKSRLKVLSDRQIVFETNGEVSLQTQKLLNEPDLKESAAITKLLDPVENVDGAQLIRILITHSPSRTFVGVSFSHMLGDGCSFFFFLKNLSRICMGLDPDLMDPISREILIPVKNNATTKVQTSLFESTGYVIPRPHDADSFSTETIYYSRERLVARKLNAANEGLALSTNDIIMSDLLKKYYRSIPLIEGKIIIRCPVDYRHFYPGLSKSYFGNAVKDAICGFEKEEVEKLNANQIGHRIRTAIQKIDKTAVTNSLQCLHDLTREKGIQIFENVGCPGLLVSNLSKFPIYQINFGTRFLGRFTVRISDSSSSVGHNLCNKNRFLDA